MKTQPLYVREMLGTEKEVLATALRSPDACEMKRAQILLASRNGLSTLQSSRQFGYSAEYARQMIHRFNEHGVACLKRKSSARQQQEKLLGAEQCQQVKQLLKDTPRAWGKTRSVWTLRLVTEVLFEKGLTPHQIAAETLRVAM